MQYHPIDLDWPDLMERPLTALNTGDRIAALGGGGTAWWRLPGGRVQGVGLQPVDCVIHLVEHADNTHVTIVSTNPATNTPVRVVARDCGRHVYRIERRPR